MKIKAFAKINIFLKLVKKRGFYHELNSRFILHERLFDEIIFEDKSCEDEFELVGDFECEKSQNSITKAYIALKEAGFANELEEFFKTKRVHVKKNIPTFAGLGGGSSDCASFLLFCNEELNLNIKKQKLMQIGLTLGADVPFFLHGVKSANVEGIGERVEEFDDDLPELELIFPKVQCSTSEVYGAFGGKFREFNPLWQNCSSKILLEVFTNDLLNDLLSPAVSLYPSLDEFAKKGYFLSGSGSCMFGVKNG